METGLVARISEETVFVLFCQMSRLKVSHNGVGDCPFDVARPVWRGNKWAWYTTDSVIYERCEAIGLFNAALFLWEVAFVDTEDRSNYGPARLSGRFQQLINYSVQKAKYNSKWKYHSIFAVHSCTNCFLRIGRFSNCVRWGLRKLFGREYGVWSNKLKLISCNKFHGLWIYLFVCKCENLWQNFKTTQWELRYNQTSLLHNQHKWCASAIQANEKGYCFRKTASKHDRYGCFACSLQPAGEFGSRRPCEHSD